MTEENKDIEQVEKKETVEKPKQQTKEINPILKNIVSILLIIFISFCLTEIIYGERPSPSCDTEPHIINSMLQSLKSAAAIYVAQERIPPNVFSDFIVPKDPIIKSKTLSLENLDGTIEGLDTKEMKITFADDAVAVYSLNGTDVQITFSSEWPTKEELKESQRKEIELDQKRTQQYYSNLRTKTIPIFAIVIGIFILLRFLFKQNITFRVLIYFAIIFGIFSCVSNQPRFTKPAIYLYPTTPTSVNITLDKRIRVTLDVPTYAPNKGWNVLAYPNGKLFDLQPHYTNCNDLNPKTFGLEYAKKACLKNRYPYIYWEGNSFKKQAPPMQNGWLVETSKFKKFLNTKLDYVGFNKIEKKEFIRYWEYKVNETKQKTVFVCFMQTALIDSYFPMTVKPKPDHINRFYIIVDLNIDNHISPMPQELTKFNREGFTLVDWGGALLKKRGLR